MILRVNLMVRRQSSRNDSALQSIHSAVTAPCPVCPRWDLLQGIDHVLSGCLCFMGGTEQRQ